MMNKNKPYVARPDGKKVKVFVRTVSGCTGAHYTLVERTVPIESTLKEYSIVDDIDASDKPLPE